MTFSSVAAAAPVAFVNENNVLIAKDYSRNYLTLTDTLFQDGLVHSYSGLELEHYAKITGNQFTISLGNKSEVNINGDTNAYLDAQEIDKAWTGGDPGNHMFYAKGGAIYRFNGNVIAKIEQADGPETVGANLLYLDGATAIVGNSDSAVQMWTIARSPDLISAKMVALSNLIRRRID